MKISKVFKVAVSNRYFLQGDVAYQNSKNLKQPNKTARYFFHDDLNERDNPADGLNIFSVDSVRSGDDEESEESEDDDVFVPKEFVEIREGDVQTYYCIEEEVGRYVSQLQASFVLTWVK